MLQEDIRRLLRAELARRCADNPRYSLRAFARAIGISHGMLSLVLNNRRRLSPDRLEKIADHLPSRPEARSLVLQAQDQKGTEPLDYLEIPEDYDDALGDAYHFVLLSLLEIPGAKFEPKWISKQAGISETQAYLSLELLNRLGLLTRTDGHWKLSGKFASGRRQASKPALRQRHRQVLERAVRALENEPTDLRSYSDFTIAMDPALVPYAQEKIRRFRRKLAADLKKHGKPSEVFRFSMQLFPETQLVPRKKESPP